MGRRKKSVVEIPGIEETPITDDDIPESDESDVDAAIAMAQSGRARPILKNRIPPPPAKIDIPDPDRPKTAAVNTKRQMTYAEAMELRTAGKLRRAVLTELGWVPANDRQPPPGIKI